MTISAQQVKELREKTGAGIFDVKAALEKSGGDMVQALKLIEERLGVIAGKKSGRTTNAGIIGIYLHSNGRIGGMLELMCETDFVARNAQFKELAHDLAMQIVALCPAYATPDNIPEDSRMTERRRLEEEVSQVNKPPHIKTEIVEGKLRAYFAPVVLTEQPFVKDQNKTVGEVLGEAVGKFGENIRLGRFARFEI